MKSNPVGYCSTFLLTLFCLLQPVQAADLLRGQRLYNMHCSVCHGLNGVPVIQQAPSFLNKERLMQPDMVLVQSVKMGRSIMPPFMGILKDDEILDVLHYARVLR
jgi:cytochrome c6